MSHLADAMGGMFVVPCELVAELVSVPKSLRRHMPRRDVA